MNDCMYLNNDGSRWKSRNPKDMKFVLVDGEKRTVRTADFYESFGNFAVTAYRVAGKRYFGLPKTHDGLETPDPSATGQNALPHVFHDRSRGQQS